VYRTIFVGLFHSILCLLILYALFSRLGYNEKYTHTRDAVIASGGVIKTCAMTVHSLQLQTVCTTASTVVGMVSK